MLAKLAANGIRTMPISTRDILWSEVAAILESRTALVQPGIAALC